MAIYHCTISNVSRSAGSSSCATLSYISAEKVKEERTAKTYNYGRCERVLACGTIIPEYAPIEFQNPSVLFNAIENHEKAENARTAKKIEIALPREFNLELQKKVVEEYVRENLTIEGYCATYAIHNDRENKNPHAHILVANRQVNRKGEWASKRKMIYATDENGNRIPRLDENGQQKTDRNGRKQWVRINAEQNPLDKKDFLKQLRKSWADVCNRYLDPGQQIDHRSYADRGIDQIPTIHEGYASKAMELRGEVSDRAETNREIREKNAIIKHLIAQLKELGAKAAEKGAEVHDRIRELLQRSRRIEERMGEGHQTAGRVAESNRSVQDTDIADIIRQARSNIDSATASRAKRDAERAKRDAERAKREAERAKREAERADREAVQAEERERHTAEASERNARRQQTDVHESQEQGGRSRPKTTIRRKTGPVR